MSNQATSKHNQKQQYEVLHSEIADILLGPDSPVRGSDEFDELIAEHDRLLIRQAELQALDAKLVEVLPGLEQAEAQFAAAEKQLAAEKKKLAGFAGELGKAAFAGLRAGELPDHPLFADRKELQARIESMHKQKTVLVAGENAGMMEKAKIQAQQLKLTAQVKVDELKIGSFDRALGTALLTSKEKPTVRCDQTEAVLKAIVSQRKLVTAAKEKIQHAEATVADRKSAAAQTLGRSKVHNSVSLRSELKEVRKEYRQNEKAIESLRKSVVTPALENESLREVAGVGEKLQQLRSLDFDLESSKTQVMKLVDDSISKFMGLPPKFKNCAYGVAGVIVLLLLVSFFGGGRDGGELLSREETIEEEVTEGKIVEAMAAITASGGKAERGKFGGVDDDTVDSDLKTLKELTGEEAATIALDVIAQDSSKYSERGFKGLVFGQTKAEVRTALEANPVDTRQEVPILFFREDRLVGCRQRYRGDNNSSLRLIRELLGEVNKDHVTQASGGSSMMSPDPSSMWSGNWRMQQVTSGWQSIAVRYYLPQVVSYGYAEWRTDSRDVRPREDLYLSFWDREWLEQQLTTHMTHCFDVCSWIESTATLLANNGELETLKYSGVLLAVDKEVRTSKRTTPEGLALFVADAANGSLESQLWDLQSDVESLERVYTQLEENESFLRVNQDKATMGDRRESNRLERLIGELEPRVAKLMEKTGFLRESDGAFSTKDRAAFKQMIGIFDEVQSQTATLESNHQSAIVVAQQIAAVRRVPSGVITVDINLSRLPAEQKEFYETLGDRNYMIEVDQCNLRAAQLVFPPKGNSINARKRSDDHLRTYSWQTSDGWTVSVFPQNRIQVTNAPQKGL